MDILKKSLVITFATLSLLITTSALANHMFLMPRPGNDIVGENYYITVEPGDSATSIRMRNKISKHELFEANPNINFYRLKVGQKILIPMQIILPAYRHGIVINMAELRLYYFSPDGETVFTSPVGMGRSNWRTPTTITKVIKKVADPTWHVPKSIKAHTLATKGILLPDAVPPGPKNPLGKYALYLQKSGYLIHGSNNPISIGTFASSGCMRLWDDPIQMLYQDVALGTKVYIIHHSSKAGWLNGNLYLEVHHSVRLNKTPTILNYIDAEQAIMNAIKFRNADIDWNKVSQVEAAQTGIPTVVGSEM